MTTTKSKGFTLIELLVVIAVIGILAAIALISLTGLQRSARDSQRKSNVSDYATAVARFYQDNQFYPNATAAAGDVDSSGNGIFSATGPLVAAPSYMPKVLTDPSQGLANCKVSASAANSNCNYRYFSSANGATGTFTSTGFMIMTTLEAPSAANGVFYINDRGTRGNVGAACTAWNDYTNCP